MTDKISQCGQRFYFDVLIIGSGLSGLLYALKLTELGHNIRIALVSKRELADSNSYYAQGGIAAAQTPEDIQSHIQDTLTAGAGLCNQPTVEALLPQGQIAIAELIKWGVKFDHNEQAYELTREGGHSHRRIYHAQDATGNEIIRALTLAIQQRPQITILEWHIGVNLITTKSHQPAHYNEVLGAYLLDINQQLIHTYIAKITILATGGAGKVYRYTSNPYTATGDGIAMAWRAGARVGNLEFYQFHPTLLYHPQQTNLLISEALRGEGAYLRRVDSGERFMVDYAPEKMELATRDIVARAIFNEIENSQYGFVYLDARHLKPDFIKHHFPNIQRTLSSLHIDIQCEMIPVVPAAHYLCGGILSDITGKTDLPRLYAIGETAFTGLHGANRLASNSLLEAAVMALNACQASLSWLDSANTNIKHIRDWDSVGIENTRRASQINAHWRGLRGEMTSYAGIVRTQEGLKDLLNLIRLRRDSIEEYYWQHIITADLVELRNIILVAELITLSALQRQESRGGHFREDYSQENSYNDTIETILLNR